ncbi:MAG: transposase [Planctomycetota bacterium]
MIRNPAEYAQAVARLAEEHKRLDEDRARLRDSGLSDEDVEKFLGPLEALHRELKDQVEEYARFMVRAPEVSTPAVGGPTIVGADVASEPAKRKSATRAKVKAKASPTSDAPGTPTPSTMPTKTTKQKGESMPRRKGMMKFGPSSSSAPKKSAAKQTRRKFSLQEKARILAEIDAAGFGEKGKVSERYGLSPNLVYVWRAKAKKSGGGTARRGRPPKAAHVNSAAQFDSTNLVDIVRENSALRTEVAALRSRMDQVKRFVAIQRQLAGEMLGAD